MIKPTIAVVFGSRSAEHDISILTAIASVIKPLELTKQFTVLPVYIAKNGNWYAGPQYKDISLFQSKTFDDFLTKQTPVSLLFQGGLKLVQVGRFGKQTVYAVDVVFPALHGTHGEDGEVMAICEMANVPYVGCDVEASVLAMDKVVAKLVAQAQGIPVTAFCHFSKHAYEADPAIWQNRVNRELKYPLFVKPAHLGSSIGIMRVNESKELANAIEVALYYDTKVIVEEGVPNLTEVTLPIMGNDELTPALLEEPAFKAEDFFDFDTKYLQQGKGKGGKTGGKGGKQGGAQGYSRIPAQLPDKLYKTAETLGLDAYRALGCQGTARVDMLIDSKTEKVYFNEVNPLPGSLYAHNWSRSGVSAVELVARLVKLAEERFAQKQRITTSFSTNYLQQF